MADTTEQVTVRLAGLNKILKALDAPSSSPAIKSMLLNWSVRYRKFLTERFVRYSQGGGPWPALRYREPVPGILWDTGTLLNALSPYDLAAPGSVNEISPDGLGVKVGYGGSDVHPTAALHGRQTTIAEIAGFHQLGGPNLPIRAPMSDPDADTITGFATDMKAAIKQIKNGS